MSNALDVEQLLTSARGHERDYDWRSGVDLYKKALELVSEQDFAKAGDIYERQGYACFKAAMQSGTADDFKAWINQAISSYQKATEFYATSSEEGKQRGCGAMLAYLSFWTASDPREKKTLLDETWSLTKASLRVLEKAGDGKTYGRTFNQLGLSAGFRFGLERTWKERKKTLTEAMEHGEQAIVLLADLGDSEELAKAYVLTATFIEAFNFYFLDVETWAKYSRRAPDYWTKAKELSEETALLELSNPISHPLTDILGWGHGGGDALVNFRRTLEYSTRTKDRFKMGTALAALSFHTWWKSFGTEDPSVTQELRNAAAKYDEESRQEYSPIIFTSPQPLYPECFWQVALIEKDVSNMGSGLARVADLESQKLREAEVSRDLEAISGANCRFSKTLVTLARTKNSPDERQRLLKDALLHANKALSIKIQISPPMHWSQAISRNILADIKRELAALAEGSESKEAILREAVRDKETSLKLGSLFLVTEPLLPVLGRWKYEFGEFLTLLYNSDSKAEHLGRAATSFLEAVEVFQKLDLAGRTAECYWRAAQAYDALDEHLKAAGNFLSASENYRIAAGKIPQLKDFYLDHVSYMDAWAEIENAKHHHRRQEYEIAKRCYEKAADLHKITKHWGYLAANYSAWAQVENAEDLSRSEQSERAIEAFVEASQLFKEGRRIIQLELGKMQNSDERDMAKKLVEAAGLRIQYCKGRKVLEEARLSARKGDYHSSSASYAEASQTLESIAKAVWSEDTRREFKLISTLSKAWEMMARAEDEASPGLYLEAARLFEEAKELSPNERARSLALGHSRFCRALEAGTKFTDTGDPALLYLAKQQLASASGYYLKSDFNTASVYARATELLFEGYANTQKAKKGEDPEKRTKLYVMAEKVFQAAAEAYLQAEQPAKREQVLRILESVRGERELSSSLLEVLHSPPIISTTASFTAPTPTREAPLGFSRFDHADIQASLGAEHSDLKIGEELRVSIQLVNAGRGPAQLVKLDGVIPEGFELTATPQPYLVEDTYLNMRGRRLDPLKTEEVRLVLKPKVQGQFTLKPKILYLDESGGYKSHEPEPVQLTVREHGERRLTAIMFTDIVGYTTLIQKNEALAMDLLDDHRKVLRGIFPRFNGREVKTMGDSFLVEFGSALDAVKCAFDIQKSLHERNATAPVDRTVSVRIGIHLGDVVHDRSDVYGDAVNVASRLEPLADPGGICVSGQVHESVKNTFTYGFESLGAHELKNVSDPVVVHKVELPWRLKRP